MSKAYHKHSGGADAFIDYYANPPYHGTPTATIHVQTIDGKTSGDQVGALFAAAPDLLEACKKLMNELDTLTGGEKDHPLANYVGAWKSELRAAIAKAEGGAK